MVRSCVYCTECSWSRCIYSHQKLSKQQVAAVANAVSAAAHECGAPLFPAGDHEEIKVRCSINCNTPVKVQYFSAKIGCASCCFHCGKKEQLLEEGDEYVQSLKRKLSIVRPLPFLPLLVFTLLPSSSSSAGGLTFIASIDNISTC
eukprot:scpid103079/ scgid13686/ 